MLCPSPLFLKQLINETWFRADKPAPFDIFGVDDEPIELFTEELQQEIKNNPRLFLWTKAHKLTPELYDRLIQEKDNAIAAYEVLLERWKRAESLFEPGDYRYLYLLDMLEKNTEDAKRFRDCFSIFLRYHMSDIAVSEIQEAKKKLTGDHAPCSINTCDRLVTDFLDQICMLMTNAPFDTGYNCMVDMPQLTMPGWEAGVVI